LRAEALIDDTDDHTAVLIEGRVGCGSAMGRILMLLFLIHYLEDPEVLAEAVSIDGQDRAGFVEDETLAAALAEDLGAEKIRRLGCGC